MWARHLHGAKRGRLWMLLGNAAILVVLLGWPYLRGRLRAQAAIHAYTQFASCLYGLPLEREPGIAPHPAEARLLAGQVLAAHGTWPRRCDERLLRIAPAPATFVLPSVKQTEALLRSEVQGLRGELRQLTRVPRRGGVDTRPLRALARVRESLRLNGQRAGIVVPDKRFALRVPARIRFAEPGRLPIFAASDARVYLRGDETKVQITAFDQNGVSYLESQAGKPFLRSRMARPANLRGMALTSGSAWLVWATSPRRCRERAAGCLSKASGFARVSWPLLELPQPTWVAGHVAGSAERSVLQHEEQLWFVTQLRPGERNVSELALASLNAATAAQSLVESVAVERTWGALADEVLLLERSGLPLALGLVVRDQQLELLELRSERVVKRSSLPAGPDSWLVGCSLGRDASLAFGTGSLLQLGTLREAGAHFWQALSLATRDVQADDGQRPARVSALCRATGAAALVLDADRRLHAVTCAERAACHSTLLASAVDGYAFVQDGESLLIAYGAREGELAIRLRRFDLARHEAAEERVPGACFLPRSGMCGVPNLARVGKRLVLLAHERTDLLALESSDLGESWHGLQVY